MLSMQALKQMRERLAEIQQEVDRLSDELIQVRKEYEDRHSPVPAVETARAAEDSTHPMEPG